MMVVIKNLPEEADFAWIVETLKQALGDEIVIEQA